jgi:hypothetical protein
MHLQSAGRSRVGRVDIPLRQTIALSLSFGHVNLTLGADVSPGNLLCKLMQVSLHVSSVGPCQFPDHAADH